MKTHTPFSELLAKATPGPFYAEVSVVKKDNGNNGYHVASCDILNRGIADAEIITRLLNWAHAGGVEALKSCAFDLEITIKHNETPGNKRTVSDAMLAGLKSHASKARAALAILNREKP